MRDLMPLALEVRKHDDVGVFAADSGSDGKRVYFSPGAVKAFAPALAELSSEPCDPPSANALSLLYGARECLPPSAERVSEMQAPRVLGVKELIE
jgi:hypothetical protein